MKNELLRYYNEELRYLKDQGEAFAKTHPKVAGRLRLGPGNVEDPLVGRLLESFAFLTARVRHKLDQQTDDIAQSLMNILYPHYLAPIPALTNVQFKATAQLDISQEIPAKTLISSKTASGQPFIFQTCYPAYLTPLNISNTIYKKQASTPPKKSLLKNIKSSLAMTVSSNKPSAMIRDTKSRKIRLHINTTAENASLIYRLLTKHTQEIIISPPNAPEQAVSIPKECIKAVGLNHDDAVFPVPGHSFSGYSLLTEFFTFQQKFFYIDIDNILEYLPGKVTNSFNLHILFDRIYPELESDVNENTLLLGCTPVINLFEKTAEPIRLDHTQTQYHIIADAHRPFEETEVYQVLDMSVSGSADDDIQCAPYFGRKYKTGHQDKQLLWHTSRKPCWELGEPHANGTETFVSFSEMNQTLNPSSQLTVTPKVLCSNRDLINQLQVNPSFQLHQNANENVADINCIGQISQPRYRDTKKIAHIDLIAHVTLQQLSFENPEETLSILRDILSLYHYDDEHDSDLIKRALIKAETRSIVRRHPETLKQGFCRGIEFSLTVDDSYFFGETAYLFGCVLNEFLTRISTINSFVQLILLNKSGEEIHKWPVKLGTKPTL